MPKNIKSNAAVTGKNYYRNLLSGVSGLLDEARRAAARSVNTILTATYWEIGRRIVEYEQKGEERAEYGGQVLLRLSKDLNQRFGRGFSPDNIELMRRFYQAYPTAKLMGNKSSLGWQGEISETLSRKFTLSWSCYVRLLALDDPHKRDFYEEEARRAGWSVREIDRQINSMLYERVALSRRKGKVLQEAERRGSPAMPEEEIKNPYIFEFLGLPEPYSEKDMESALIQHLADFLLELGYGFTFVARQKRLQIGSESYYIDLLFYHRHLRCLVAIDLKLGKFTHADAGQMNLYLNYLRENETLEEEMPPIGLILCAEKDESVAHYALGGLNNKIFASTL